MTLDSPLRALGLAPARGGPLGLGDPVIGECGEGAADQWAGPIDPELAPRGRAAEEMLVAR